MYLKWTAALTIKTPQSIALSEFLNAVWLSCVNDMPLLGVSRRVHLPLHTICYWLVFSIPQDLIDNKNIKRILCSAALTTDSHIIGVYHAFCIWCTSDQRSIFFCKSGLLARRMFWVTKMVIAIFWGGAVTLPSDRCPRFVSSRWDCRLS